MPPNHVEDFIDDVFNNILDLRECNKRLLEVLYVRQREQGPVIQKVGDIFLEAATEFRLAYPAYTGHYPTAEKRLKEEMEKNHELKLFLEVMYRWLHSFHRAYRHLAMFPGLRQAQSGRRASV